MSKEIIQQLRGIERALALRESSPEQRRRLKPILDLLCLQLGRSIGRSSGA